MVREDAGQAFARQDLPFDRLVEELGIARDPGRNPVFQVLFVLQNAGRATPRVAGLELTPLEADTATAKFDLTLSVVPAPVTEGAEAEDCKQALFEFATDLFDPAGIEMMGACFAELVMRLSVEADAPMSSIALTAAGMAAAADDDGW